MYGVSIADAINFLEFISFDGAAIEAITVVL
jgi:hypothetical protein